MPEFDQAPAIAIRLRNHYRGHKSDIDILVSYVYALEKLANEVHHNEDVNEHFYLVLQEAKTIEEAF